MSTTSSTNVQNLEQFWAWLGDTELAFQIGATWWFPLLESIHVLGACTLVGSVFMVDLRLLGWAATRYHLHTFLAGLTKWAWFGLALSLPTGLGLFISRPAAYAANPAFQVKMILLALAAANVFAAHRLILRVHEDIQATTNATRSTGGASLLIWICVILAGRWVGHIN